MIPLKRKHYDQWRERRLMDLARQNPEYEYVCQKKYPDPVLPYNVWIRKLVKETKR